MQKIKELVQLGGFSDSEYLRRTMAKEFQQMASRFPSFCFSSISASI